MNPDETNLNSAEDRELESRRDARPPDAMSPSEPNTGPLAPQNPPLAKCQPQMSGEFGRTGLIVHLTALCASAALWGVSWLVGFQSKDSEAFAGVSISVAIVGVLWSLLLTIRALKRRESFLTPACTISFFLLELSAVTLPRWVSHTRVAGKTFWMDQYWLPVVLPMLVLAWVCAWPPALVLARRERKAGTSHIRSRCVFAAIFALVLLLPGSFLYFAFGATRNESWDRKEHPQSVAVRWMPDAYGDALYFVLGLFGTRGERLQNCLVENGHLSDDVLQQIRSKGGSIESEAIRGLLKRKPPDFFLREAVKGKFFGQMNYEIGKLCANEISLRSLSEAFEHLKKCPKDFMIGLWSDSMLAERLCKEIKSGDADLARSVLTHWARGSDLQATVVCLNALFQGDIALWHSETALALQDPNRQFAVPFAIVFALSNREFPPSVEELYLSLGPEQRAVTMTLLNNQDNFGRNAAQLEFLLRQFNDPEEFVRYMAASWCAQLATNSDSMSRIPLLLQLPSKIYGEHITNGERQRIKRCHLYLQIAICNSSGRPVSEDLTRAFQESLKTTGYTIPERPLE
jgi:hypothetical protein